MKKYIVLFILFCFSIPIVFSVSIQKSTDDYENCSVFWLNPENVLISDNVRASVSTGIAGLYECYWRNFSVEIPVDAIIDEVLVKTEMYSNDEEYEDMYVAVWNKTERVNNVNYPLTSSETIYITNCSDPAQSRYIDWEPDDFNDNATIIRLTFRRFTAGGLMPDAEVSILDNKPCLNIVDCWNNIKMKKVKDLRIGDKIMGWNWTTGFTTATITNVILYPKGQMYRIIAEYPNEMEWLCEELVSFKTPEKVAIMKDLGLNESKCYKDFAVSFNHLVWDPVKHKDIPAYRYRIGDHITGLYLNKNNELILVPSKVIKIIPFVSENVHIEIDTDFAFAHYQLIKTGKDTTSYVDWIAVNVTYHTTTTTTTPTVETTTKPKYIPERTELQCFKDYEDLPLLPRLIVCEIDSIFLCYKSLLNLNEYYKVLLCLENGKYFYSLF